MNKFFSLPENLLCTIDADGSFHDTSTWFENVLGYSEKDLKNQNLFEIIHPEDVEKTQKEFSILKNGGKEYVRNHIHRCRHKNGSYHWITWASSYDSKSELLYAVGRDISDEKSTREKLESLLETKDRLFSILAHDLRGTLEGVMTMAELLKGDVQREAKEESLIDGLSLMASTARSTNELLNNQLNWFFMQMDTFKPNFVELDIRRCVKHAINIYMSMAVNKKIRFKLDGQKSRVQGDWNMLCIVFRNLISNAIKFSYAGSKIDITIKNLNKSSVVSVRDQGIGIPDDIRSRLFDSDDSILRPGTNQEQSSGLGLQLCKEIMLLHQGKITVESEEDKGTTFSVELPNKLK